LNNIALVHISSTANPRLDPFLTSEVRLRPHIWHAEWHYFYLMLALAVWSVFFR
jgi:hypothetical protein